MERSGLYEYLGRQVGRSTSAGTRWTEVVGETYDDDPGLGYLGMPVAEGTTHTRQDFETYDDDPGLAPLSLPLSAGTRITLVDAETYDDDPGISGLAVPDTSTPNAGQPSACRSETTFGSGSGLDGS